MRFGSPEYAQAKAEYEKNPKLCVVCCKPMHFVLMLRGADCCGAICRAELSAKHRKGQKRKPKDDTPPSH